MLDISLAAIEAAQKHIAPWVERTPLIHSRVLSDYFHCPIYLKLEILQPTGAFKVRGAFNKLLSLSELQRHAGVVTVSAGNHGRAVAYAAKALGVRAIVLMPENTSTHSIHAVKKCAAEVVLTPTLADAINRVPAYLELGYTPIHPFDDALVIAGQGTIGLELLEDLPALTDVIVSIGGGGLISGIATAIKAIRPAAKVFGVQVEGADAMWQAFNAGRVVQLAEITSIAKTLGAPAVAEMTLRIAKRTVEKLIHVTNAETFNAQRFLLEQVKLVTEPAAACTLAAAEVMRETFDAQRHVVLVLCGGNSSLAEMCQLAQRFPPFKH